MIELLPTAIFLVILLFGGHAIADYGLQSAYMAEKKSPAPDNADWALVLSAHCLIHAFFVAVISFLFLGFAGVFATGWAAFFGVAEFLAHFAIDRRKGRGKLSYRQDQALHYGCKLLWAGCMMNIAFYP